ncbi:MAG: NERD domain-containing protein [Gammaproteobacteria bacterium]|nr:NERD domain-containing protein [Gammaproteobacteria bacterium]MDH4253696.1 NERD domain-containing protein [Gammaproteobacteria bacterium]MDH5310681.1 NERD domain-containing protein [Gammaproteobacteria bacterium]
MNQSLGPLTLIVAAATAVLPAVALATGVPTGIQNTGAGLVLIGVAGALFLALLFRGFATSVARVITARFGRRRVSRVLRQRSADVMDNFILPGAYGGLTRIDHVILTSGGILCVLAKHYNGIVFGEPDEPQWTNVDGVQRRKFLNPQIQNEGRARALRKALPGVPVASLVVFTGSVQFTSPRENNVIHVRELDSYIAKFVFGPSRIEDWDAVWLSLKSTALTDDASRKDMAAQLSFG